MIGNRFSTYVPPPSQEKGFGGLNKIFLHLLQLTNGDVSETLTWMNELDQQYKFTDPAYGMGDFIHDLKENGFITDIPGNGNIPQPTSKTEQSIRKSALEEIFGKLKKNSVGNVGSSRVDLQACKLEYSIVSPK